MAEALNDPVETPLVAETTEDHSCHEGTPILGNYQPPRLGIIHLLAWVTLAAILMKYNLALETFKTNLSEQSENFRFCDGIFDALYAIYAAAMLVGATVLWLDRFHRKPGRLQPGHWLLGLYAMITLAYYLWSHLSIWLQDSPKYLSQNLFLWYNAGINLVISLALFWGSFRLLEPLRWKWCFVFLGMKFLFCFIDHLRFVCFYSSSLSAFFVETTIFILLCTAVLVFVVMIVDIIKGCRRDWLHWLGAINPIFLAAFSTSWDILSEILESYNQ